MRKKHYGIVLLVILLLAALVRIWGIDYGLPCTYCRPDEDRLINTALRLSGGDLNPHYFIWPGLFFYLTRGVLEATTFLAGWIEKEPGLSSRALYLLHPSLFHLVLRFIFCAFGVASVFFLYRLGKKMFSPATGLLAAFFLSLSFLHARDSHFAMLDIPATLLGVIFFLKAWDIYRKGRWSDYLWSGLWCGLSLGTKYYGGLLLIPLLAAHFSRPPVRAGMRRNRWFDPRFWAAVALVVSVLAATSPYLFLDAGSSYRQIKEDILTSQFVEGFDLVPRVRTARGWLHHLTFSLRYALGWPLELICLLGVGYAAWRGWRGEAASRLVLAFLLPFYAALALQKSCFVRYTMLLLPFLCLAGAELIIALGSRKRKYAWLMIPVVLIAVSDSAFRLVRHNILLSRPDTRMLASAWMEENIPLNSLILFPHPLIFGRPFASFKYPHRISLPGEEKREFLQALLPFSSRGIKYLIIDEHPLAYSELDPELKELMTEGADLIYRVQAYRKGETESVYDPFDAYYIPLAGLKNQFFPGPTIEIYRLR